MKRYDILFHHKYGFQAVKLGFSWPAFFFPQIWAIYKRLWLYAFFAVSVTMVIVYMETQYPSTLAPAALVALRLSGLLVYVVFGVFGNQLYRNELYANAYELLRSIEANSPESAISQAVEFKAFRKTAGTAGKLTPKLDKAKAAYLKREYKKAYDLFLEAEAEDDLDSMSKRIKHQALMRIKLGVL